MRAFVFVLLLSIAAAWSPFESGEDPLFTGFWWIRLAIACVLVISGGIFAGLTLGLMALDELNLKVLVDTGTEAEKRHARRILPLRRDGHLLLVTLLLANTVTNETLPIVLQGITSGIASIIASTCVVVLFGEVIPQAVCSRYGLQIGSYMAWLVWIMVIIFYPVAKPIALLIDCLLGKDHGVLYKRAGLKSFVSEHSVAHGGDLDDKEVGIIRGALEMVSKTAADVMTPIKEVFSLSIDSVLDEQTMRRLTAIGHSRVPIYDGDERNLVGLLLVKTLIMLDPAKCTPIKDLIPPGGMPHRIFHVEPDTTLVELMDAFQMGRSHLCVVSQPSSGQRVALGVVTLEDVVEELIGQEIYDESEVAILADGKTATPRRRKPDDLGPTHSVEQIVRAAFQGTARPLRRSASGIRIEKSDTGHLVVSKSMEKDTPFELAVALMRRKRAMVGTPSHGQLSVNEESTPLLG